MDNKRQKFEKILETLKGLQEEVGTRASLVRKTLEI